MTRFQPLVDPSDDEIRTLVVESLALKKPVPSKLLALWLHLPIIVDSPSGPIKHRSSLEAALQHCRIVTHRDDNGEVRDGCASGDWLGAVGYLMLLDQIGSSVRSKKPHGIPYGQSGFLMALADFTDLSENDSLGLYALRNSLAHNFSLVNVPPKDMRMGKRKRRKMTQLFTLTEGTGEIVQVAPTKVESAKAQ